MSFFPPAASLLALLAFVPPAFAQVRPALGEQDAGTPKPKVLGVEITYLANAGFFLQSGRFHVLIDAFLREPYQVYAALPAELYKDLVQARPPFDQLTLVFVSHDHADHVQHRGLEKYLANNDRAQLLTSPQVIASLKGSARDFPAIQRRVTPVKVRPGSAEVLMQEEMNISFIEMEHVGKESADVQNLAHLITMGGMKILHVGDAEPSVEGFAGYQLGTQEIDIALLPYWFFGTERGRRVLAEQLHARVRIAYHIPPNDLDKFGALIAEQFPDVILFREALEKRSFLPAGVAAAAPAPETGPGTEPPSDQDG